MFSCFVSAAAGGGGGGGGGGGIASSVVTLQMELPLTISSMYSVRVLTSVLFTVYVYCVHCCCTLQV